MLKSKNNGEIFYTHFSRTQTSTLQMSHHHKNTRNMINTMKEQIQGVIVRMHRKEKYNIHQDFSKTTYRVVVSMHQIEK